MVETNSKLTAIIIRMLFRVVRYSIIQPRTSINTLKLIYHQIVLSSLRKKLSTNDIPIPAFMIYSITKHCNLICKGCYARVHQSEIKMELETEKVETIFKQARDLGIGIIMLAGGEPLTRIDIVALCKYFPELLFPIFTNGVLLTKNLVKNLSQNIVPVISLEGNQIQTDNRRGNEVYRTLKSRFVDLQQSSRFWGVSITVNNENIDEVLSDSFVSKLIKHRCKLFFYVEYVPINPDSEYLVLTDKDKEQLIQRTDSFSKKYPGLFVAFPGDEEKWGGCLAAGRGFVHIQADGSLEPCPFAPYSDTSLQDMSLHEALKSQFLSKIRKKHHLLHETKGGCALWENRDLVKQILDSDD